YGRYLWPPALQRKAHHEELLPTRPLLFGRLTSLPMDDGLPLKLPPARPRRRNPPSGSCLLPADRGPASWKGGIGTTSLAGLPTARRFTSYLTAAASSMCGEFTSMPLKESLLENPSV